MKMNEYQTAMNRFIGHFTQTRLFPDSNDKWNNKLFEQDRKTLQQLVDRATPMKVFETDHSFVCRNCSNIFTMKYEGMCVPCLSGIKYCPSCGQAQDWSDIND